MRSKTKEIREAAIKVVMNKTLTAQEAADLFGVHRSTIYSWIHFFKTEGRIDANHPTGRKPLFTEELKEKLVKLVDEQHDRTLEELAEALGNVVHFTTIHRQLKLMGYDYKKNSQSSGTRSRRCEDRQESMDRLSKKDAHEHDRLSG
ncbi:MAG: helix-turn-helix domain-containing protein [Mailhella sp.]|nr:helix-turn-helix domain-containing protein [Mailhella sp.]